RKFGLAAKAAMLHVKQLGRGADNFFDDLGREICAAPGKGFGAGDGVHGAVGRLDHITVLFPVGLRNGEQNALESRTSVEVFWRKIRSTVKRLAFGGEKGRQRPAALPANGGDPCLIAAVYIGALIAI